MSTDIYNFIYFDTLISNCVILVFHFKKLDKFIIFIFQFDDVHIRRSEMKTNDLIVETWKSYKIDVKLSCDKAYKVKIISIKIIQVDVIELFIVTLSNWKVKIKDWSIFLKLGTKIMQLETWGPKLQFWQNMRTNDYFTKKKKIGEWDFLLIKVTHMIILKPSREDLNSKSCSKYYILFGR